MRVVFDIEANGFLDHKTVDYSSIPFKLKDTFKIHCIVAKDIDTEEVYAFYDGDKIPFEDVKYTHFQLKEWPEFSNNLTQVVGHNIIDYDLPVLDLVFNAPYTVYPDTLNGREVKIDDTYILSKLLNPDRFGGHSLASWGKRVGLDKISFGKESEEQWEVFTPEMLYYCIRDVEVNVKTLHALKKEWGNWKWNEAYQLEKAVAEIIFRQKHFGFDFDDELGKKAYEDLVEKMQAIEDKVEPLFPEKAISKGAAKEYIPPKQQFKKDFTLSHHMVNFIEKHNGKVGKSETAIKGVRKKVEIQLPKTVWLYGQEYELPMCNETPIVSTEPMKLSHQTEIKQHLISIGWEPINWKEKDLTLDSKKRKLSPEKFEATVDRYVEDTLGSEFERFRCEKVKCNPVDLRAKLLRHDLNKPLKVYSSPSFTVDAEKTLCPNLLRLGKKVDYVEDIVKWLTYRHRRNSIFSPAESSESKKVDTGWLTEPRLDVDGRIPTPADTLGCNTARFQHRSVANIPKCSTLYGEVMRSLFTAGEDYYQLGYDADGLEARIEGHYTIKYKGGKKYAHSLIAEKPNDVHTQTKNKIIEITGINDFTRDSAKTVKYACLPVSNTEVLTLDGWRKYSELKEGQPILSYNPTTRLVEKDVIKKLHFYPNAEVFKTSNSLHSFESTKDHMWFGWQRRMKGSRKTSVNRFNEWKFFSTDSFNTEKNILCSAPYIGGDSKVTVEQAGLMGWILSDGYYTWSKKQEITSSSEGKRKGIRLCIDQATHKYCNEIQELLSRNGLKFSISPKDIGKGKINKYLIKSSHARKFVDEVVGCRKDKHEVDWVKWVLNLTPEALDSFVYNFWLGDGNSKGKNYKTTSLVFSQNKGNISEALELALFLKGRRVTRTFKEGKCETIRQLRTSHLTLQETKTERVEDKDVFCLTTKNSTFIIRQEGFLSITGNCAYGAQPPKLAQQNGWPLDLAKQVFNGYWQASAPLKTLKGNVESYWSNQGQSRYIPGLDGRKLLTRSKHSLVNILFQSAGVICMKRAMVILDRWLMERGLTINVFRDTIEGKEYTLQMIAYHDEGQNAVTKGLVDIKTFDTEEAAKNWKAAREESTGKIYSDIGHKGDKYYVAYSIVGELAAKSVAAGGEYYKLRVPLSAGYMVGKNWADCH